MIDATNIRRNTRRSLYCALRMRLTALSTEGLYHEDSLCWHGDLYAV
ncbi:MAG: hypothetical protein ACOYMG_19000 [Candidatus Methylumidiphilus sp.]